MDAKDFINALTELRKVSPKRKFNQSVDLIITVKNLDLKKPDNQVDAYITLPHDKGKKVSIGAFVQTELAGQAKEICDEAIHADQFPKYEGDKKLLRRLVRSHDFFIAQSTVMPQVAKVFGRYLGPKGKMPNPKVGCVVPPTATLKPLVERLKKTVKVVLKTQPVLQVLVGKEQMSDEDLAANLMAVYNGLVSRLPSDQNVKGVFLKLSMGPKVYVGKVGKEAPKPEEAKEEKVAKKKEKPKEKKKKAEEKKKEPKVEAKTAKEEKKEEPKPEEVKEEKIEQKKEEEKQEEEKKESEPEKKEEKKETKKVESLSTETKVAQLVEAQQKRAEPKPSAEELEEGKEEPKPEEKPEKKEEAGEVKA